MSQARKVRMSRSGVFVHGVNDAVSVRYALCLRGRRIRVRLAGCRAGVRVSLICRRHFAVVKKLPHVLQCRDHAAQIVVGSDLPKHIVVGFPVEFWREPIRVIRQVRRRVSNWAGLRWGCLLIIRTTVAG